MILLVEQIFYQYLDLFNDIKIKRPVPFSYLEPGPKVFINISKTTEISFNIIETRMFILTFYSCSLVLSNVDMLHSKEFSLDRILNPVFYVIFKRETFFESLYSESCFELSLDTVHFNYVLFSFVQPNVNYFLIKQKTHRYRKRQQR